MAARQIADINVIALACTVAGVIFIAKDIEMGQRAAGDNRAQVLTRCDILATVDTCADKILQTYGNGRPAVRFVKQTVAQIKRSIIEC